MSEAIENAEVITYGVSEKYKESANVSCTKANSQHPPTKAIADFVVMCFVWSLQCRLELSYAMKEKVDLIPLMMQEGCECNSVQLVPPLPCQSGRLTLGLRSFDVRAMQTRPSENASSVFCGTAIVDTNV